MHSTISGRQSTTGKIPSMAYYTGDSNTASVNHYLCREGEAALLVVVMLATWATLAASRWSNTVMSLIYYRRYKTITTIDRRWVVCN